MGDIIRFEDVSKIYKGDIVALENVNFSAEKGEFFFVIGPSGAGKSTLIRLLIREEYPSQGNIHFEKVLVTEIPRKMLSVYRQHLGVVFQELNLIENKTVAENIRFAMEILRKPKKEMNERTEELLELISLQDRAKLFPNDLSGGEKQKVAIARALANNPKLFIADEPTGNLDPGTSFEILEILKEINKAGTTVMVVSHDRELVNAMRTRVVVMDKGRIVDDYKGLYQDVVKDSASENSTSSTSKTTK